MPYRNAASVLPEPVGAWISVCLPLAIAGQPRRCAGVAWPNAFSNQPLVAGEKTSRGFIPARLLVKIAPMAPEFLPIWTATMAAMMLPSTVPLLRLDYATTHSRARTLALAG